MEYIPKWIAWESTQKCNLNCVHCRGSAARKLPLIAKDAIDPMVLIDQVSEISKPVLVLSGGEPLLRKDIFEIAEYGTSKGLKMAMATNGLLVNDKVCAQIKASGIRVVSLSLDGSTAEIHDKFRQQKGSFDGVLRAAEFFRKHEIRFIINSSFTQKNQTDIAKTFQLAKSLKPEAWYMFMIVPTGRGEDLFEDLVTTKDYSEILTWHYEQEKKEDDLLMRPTCAPHYYRLVEQLNKKDDDKLKRRSLTFSTGGSKGCIAGQSIVYIDHLGNVNPCSYLPVSAGNLHETSFKDIWFNSKVLNDMRDFKSYKGRCGKCEYVNICGGCRARAYAKTGDYMAEEPFCDYNGILKK